jgi:hypothetical protein
MKKALLVLTLLVAVALPAQAEVKIRDMSPDHWAYDSIQMLVDRGYIAIYETGDFRPDQPVSRAVFAAALSRLIGQIENGELKLGATDMKEIKKLSEEFSSEMSDYDTRVAALEQRLADVESGKVVIQTDISKSTVEFRDKYDEIKAENEKLKQDLAMLQDQLEVLSGEIKKEAKQRKKSTTTLWLGVLVAGAVGAASN